MGEYWKPVNIDKHQQVHPHKVGDGLKLPEWYHDENSGTRRRIRDLQDDGRWSGRDEIRVVSDYGGSLHYAGPETDRPADYDDDWEDVSR